MSEYAQVKVVGAPGFEDFDANLIMTVKGTDGIYRSIVADLEYDEPFVVRSQYVVQR